MGCDLQCRKMSNFDSEFSKTEHAQKTPVRIANEGLHTGAVRISTAVNLSNGFLFFSVFFNSIESCFP